MPPKSSVVASSDPHRWYAVQASDFIRDLDTLEDLSVLLGTRLIRSVNLASDFIRDLDTLDDLSVLQGTRLISTVNLARDVFRAIAKQHIAKVRVASDVLRYLHPMSEVASEPQPVL